MDMDNDISHWHWQLFNAKTNRLGNSVVQQWKMKSFSVQEKYYFYIYCKLQMTAQWTLSNATYESYNIFN